MTDPSPDELERELLSPLLTGGASEREHEKTGDLDDQRKT
jgi:hypothetical protein